MSIFTLNPVTKILRPPINKLNKRTLLLPILSENILVITPAKHYPIKNTDALIDNKY